MENKELKEIQDLIKNDKCTYALEVQCVSTWYRKLYQISQGATINLDPEMIHERVELTPCIVAKQEIKKFRKGKRIKKATLLMLLIAMLYQAIYWELESYGIAYAQQ